MYRRLFRNRNFVALWVGQIIAFIGDYFVLLAAPIAINRLTGSTMMVGLSYIAGAIPALLMGPVAGVFIDRWDRRKVMILSDLLRGALVLLMLLVNTADQVWIYYVVNFLIACTSQFFIPARGAVLPLIVEDEDDLLAANGLMQVVQTVGFLIGPALAGFAIDAWGEKPAFVANSIGYVCSAIAVSLMAVPLTTLGRGGGNTIRAVLGEMRNGLSFLFRTPSTLGVTVMLTVFQLGIGAFAVVWVPFLQKYFNQGARGIGFVDSAFGLGMVLGGLLLGLIGKRVRLVSLAGSGMLLLGLLTFPIGYLPTFFLIVLVNFLWGIGLVPVQSALSTILQLAVPDALRGRVMSGLNASITSGGLISMALTAFLGEAIGLPNVFILMGVVITLSGLLGFRLLKEPEGRPAEAHSS